MKLHAICMVCSEEASRTQRLVDGRPAAWDRPAILISADDTTKGALPPLSPGSEYAEGVRSARLA